MRGVWGNDTDLSFLKGACNQQGARQANEKGQASCHLLLLAPKALGALSTPQPPCQVPSLSVLSSAALACYSLLHIICCCQLSPPVCTANDKSGHVSLPRSEGLSSFGKTDLPWSLPASLKLQNPPVSLLGTGVIGV